MTARIEVNQAAKPQRRTTGKLLWASLMAILVASIANLGIYALASRFLPTVGAWPGAGPGQIVGATVAYLFIGTIILVLVSRLSTQPVRHYQLIATAGLLISLALPISAAFGYGTPPGTPPADLTTVIVLSLMHVIAYAISVPLFIRTLRK